MESQKQRISLLQYSLVLIAALFGYLVTDKALSPADALFLIALTIVPSLFSYSTRCRERRIAHYLQVFLARLTPWSILSSSNLQLGFFQRSSTAIVVLMLLFDLVLLGIAWPFPSLTTSSFDFKSISKGQAQWVLAFVVLALNALVAWRIANLPCYVEAFGKARDELMKTWGYAESATAPAREKPPSGER